MTRPAPKPPRQGGFTLLEVIAALAVLGIILASLAQLVHYGSAAMRVQQGFSSRAEDIARVDRTLRRLINFAAPPTAADDRVLTGEAHRVTLLSLLPRQPQTDPIRRARVALGVDDRHRLLLRWSPQPNAVQLTGALPPIQEIVLLEGVDHLDLRYRQALGDGGAWKDVWTDTSLPALLRLHIVFVDEKRHWPDMLIATLIDSNGSF